MKKYYSKNLLLLATLLLAITLPTFAQEDESVAVDSILQLMEEAAMQPAMQPMQKAASQPNVQPTLATETVGNKKYYKIGSDEDFETFRQIVATGNPYANAILTQNVTAKEPIGGGDEQFHYRGTFDGQGHTITLDMYNFENKPYGLFQYTKPGCVIRNLEVAGELGSHYPYYGSIVGDATGTTIEQCISRAILNGEGHTSGGLVGIAHGECFLENCAYIGHLSEYCSQQNSGLVGVNEQMLSIKSCYSAPTAKKKYSVFTDRLDEYTDGDTKGQYQISLNNYYVKNSSDYIDMSNLGNATAVTQDQMLNGTLCYRLNQNGRKGVVWYQNGVYPYPFKTEGSKLIFSHDLGVTFDNEYDNCIHDTRTDEEPICLACGDIKKGIIVDPLQNSGQDSQYKNDEIFVGYLRYNLTTTNGQPTATVRGTHHIKKADGSGYIDKDARAVHIPETITYNGIKYTVNKIDNKAFNKSGMEYCYIPQTVTRIENDAFNKCSNLTYLHIADGPVGNEHSLWLGENEDEFPDQELFYDSPLKTVYIGRNLMWDAATGNDAPFEDRKQLSEVLWGPRVTRIGNHRYGDDPRNGYNCDLFDGSSNISKVYFMGDEASMEQKDVRVFNYEGLREATNFYINRNIFIGKDDQTQLETKDYIIRDKNGILKNCKNVAFGPFANYIGNDMFAKAELKSFNLDNAFNLSEIRGRAFDNCKGVGVFTVPASVTSIQANAFNESDFNVFTIDYSSTPLEILGDGGFAHGLNTITIDRDVKNFHCNSGTWIIGPNVNTLRADEFADRTSTVFIPYSATPLKCETGAKLKIGDLLYLDRDLEGENNNIAFISNSKGSMKALNFGSHISNIPLRMFAGMEKITSLMIPKNITHIGTAAFQHCTNLEVISILGEPTVESAAFSNEDNLKYLFLMGSTIDLKDGVFQYSNNLKEVYTGFYQDPGASSESAFDSDVYQNSILSCAGDQDSRYGGVELTSEPWVRWRNNDKQQALLTTDIFSYVGDQKNKAGRYDRAVLSHDFPAGQMEMVYMPFDVDSYFFGVDAEIYRLALEDDNVSYSNSIVYSDRVDNSFCLDNVDFVKVNLDREKTLSKGNIYFIKVKDHDEQSLGGYYSLFNSQAISIEKAKKNYRPTEMWQSSSFQGGMWGANTIASSADHKYYTYDEGVIKLINGEYPIDITTVVIEGFKDGTRAFNLVNDQKILTTSKSDLPFNLNLEGYSTFYAADYNYVAPDWCKVYIITSAQEGEEVEMVEIEDRTITKGQAVLLKSVNDAKVEGGLSECLTYATNGSSCSFTGNLLKGVEKDQLVSELGRDFIYVLGCNNNYENVGFYKFMANKKMSKGKAYLDPEGLSPQALAKACLFVCNDAATGIKAEQNAERRTQDGIYDLMGRRLKEAGFKGIYIVNGKKVVIK